MTDQFKIDKSITLEETQIMQKALEEVQVPENWLCTHERKMGSK